MLGYDRRVWNNQRRTQMISHPLSLMEDVGDKERDEHKHVRHALVDVLPVDPARRRLVPAVRELHQPRPEERAEEERQRPGRDRSGH